MKSLSQELVSTSTSATHREHELTKQLQEKERAISELQSTLETKHNAEMTRILSHNTQILKDHHKLLQSVPSNLKMFTKSVHETERQIEDMEYMMQQKMSKQIEEYENSRIIEIENIKQQYEMWLKQKDAALQQMVEGLNKYRAKKAQQLRMCEQEIIVLYEYTMKIETILKNAERGVYTVAQRNAAAEAPTTGLIATQDMSSQAFRQTGNATVGPLRLGGILLPKGLRPMNPLADESDDCLALTKRILKKHRETTKKMMQMKEEAFQKAMGKTSIGVNAPLDPVLTQKIQSMFLTGDQKTRVDVGGDMNATGKSTKRPSSSNNVLRSSAQQQSITGHRDSDDVRLMSSGNISSAGRADSSRRLVQSGRSTSVSEKPPPPAAADSWRDKVESSGYWSEHLRDEGIQEVEEEGGDELQHGRASSEQLDLNDKLFEEVTRLRREVSTLREREQERQVTYIIHDAPVSFFVIIYVIFC